MYGLCVGHGSRRSSFIALIVSNSSNYWLQIQLFTFIQHKFITCKQYEIQLCILHQNEAQCKLSIPSHTHLFFLASLTYVTFIINSHLAIILQNILINQFIVVRAKQVVLAMRPWLTQSTLLMDINLRYIAFDFATGD